MSSDAIELGEDTVLFNNCFELISILQNSSYYSDVIVLDKKIQNHYELQVAFKTFY